MDDPIELRPEIVDLSDAAFATRFPDLAARRKGSA
jgi:hypothetical protein